MFSALVLLPHAHSLLPSASPLRPYISLTPLTVRRAPLIYRSEKTRLRSLSTVYIAGHVLGGLTGTPTVLRATKSWYGRIPLPSYTPPNGVFGPIWSLLYASLGYAIARISSRGLLTRQIGILWAVHMALNYAWAPIFFGMKRLQMGLWINFTLIASLIGGIIPAFLRADPLSGYLLFPYAVWLSFAAFLNAGICRLNPTEKSYNNAKLEADLEVLRQDAAKRVGL